MATPQAASQQEGNGQSSCRDSGRGPSWVLVQKSCLHALQSILTPLG